MIELKGNNIKLCLLDTNVLSELLKNRKPYFKILYELYPLSNYMFCYSVISIIEIKKIKPLFERYIEVFSHIPSFIMNGHGEIFNEELRHYENSDHHIKAWAIYPANIKSKSSMSNEDKLRYVLTTKYITSKEKEWVNSREEIINGIISLKKNYPPKKDKYSEKEIINFAEIVTAQQIIYEARDFVEQEKKAGRTINISLFPSVKTISYVVFYNFYVDERKPKISDAFDIIISSLLPYVDVFITESHQNEVINKIKKVDSVLDHLENRSLKSIL